MMLQLLKESLHSALTSAVLILKLIIPLYILADVLLYFDLLRHISFLFTPITGLLDLPPEAAMALAGGMLINLYAAIAFAAPLDLSPYQWTVLAVFLGVCHALVVESAIMAKLGISYGYSILLRLLAAFVTTLPVLLLPQSFFTQTGGGGKVPAQVDQTFWEMLLHSGSNAVILSFKIILLISIIVLVMDLLKSAPIIKDYTEKVSTAFSIIVGQLLGITYGAGLLIREVNRGTLSREDLFFIGTFLMICHSIIEDVLLFVLFGANLLVVAGVRLTGAVVLSFLLLRLFRIFSFRLAMRQ